ncbi:MAG: hypothetical protein QXP66_00920 [Candidatus Aenigmatarchaeota archaeon]
MHDALTIIERINSGISGIVIIAAAIIIVLNKLFPDNKLAIKFNRSSFTQMSELFTRYRYMTEEFLKLLANNTNVFNDFKEVLTKIEKDLLKLNKKVQALKQRGKADGTKNKK